MIYKRFYFIIIIRVIVLFATGFWLSFSFHVPEKIYTLITISSLVIIQLIGLINYINKTNRELARFFNALKDKDSSSLLRFSDNKGVFKELAGSLNEISELIGKSRIESEKSSKYFEFVVEHIPIGILTLNTEGKIIHSNKALRKLLKSESLSTFGKLIEINNNLALEIKKLKPGEQKVLRIKIQSSFIQVLIHATQFSFDDENLKLISIQDVKNELEDNELSSWQKLIRVLTHEIMNSVTPITTLTVAINKGLKKKNQIATIDTITNEDIKDVLINVDLIEERSIGLRNFVEKYKSLTKIKSLKTSKVGIFELLNNSISLFKNEIKQKSVKVQLHVNPKTLEIEADKNLVEQVIINLIKNSLEAFKSNTDNQITLTGGYNSDNRIEIILKDNGTGIPDDQINEIFMPFYTTKEQGSGIGLSLARQIMQLHGGNISVQSDPEMETTFTLEF